jgi:hypothetical protein
MDNGKSHGNIFDDVDMHGNTNSIEAVVDNIHTLMMIMIHNWMIMMITHTLHLFIIVVFVAFIIPSLINMTLVE